MSVLQKLNILPRWIIFLIDISISSFSIGLSYLILENFVIDHVHLLTLIYAFYINLIVAGIVFIGMKVFAGIVRYTSMQDTVRILLAMVVVGMGLFTVNTISFIVSGSFLLPTNVIIVHVLLSFVFLSSYRFLIKYVFEYLKEDSNGRTNAIIFGAGQAGLIAKRAIDQDVASKLKIVAIIDDDERKTSTKIDGVMVYNALNDLERLINEHEVKQVIVAIQNLSIDRKNQIVDVCLNCGVKILNVPPTKDWINGQLKSNQIRDVRIEDLLDRDSIAIHNDSIDAQLSGKRILITGAAGSIGSELVRQIMRFSPAALVICDQSETALHNLELELEDGRNDMVTIVSRIADVRNRNSMEQIFTRFKPHYVYHAAAYKHVPLMEKHPAEAIFANLLGTKIIADLSIKYGVNKFVMISTDKAVNPTNVMGASKRIAEIYTQALGLSPEQGNAHKTKFITTRFGNVLGSNGSVIPRFKQQLQNGGPITVTHPEITRYFMTIPEACQLVLEAGSMGNGGEIYIFDMGRAVKIIDLAAKMIRLAGLKPYKDIDITFTGLRPGEKLYEELLSKEENTLPTHHPKIMIAKVREYKFEEVKVLVDELIKAAKSSSDVDLVRRMKDLVPEFKSNNSVFEELDFIHEETGEYLDE